MSSQVVAAPTGCGKTFLFELAIVRLLQEAGFGQPDKAPPRPEWKIVYLAPLKALVQQRLFDWLGRFGSLFGIKCVEISGDSPSSSSLRDLASSQLIFTTPEKWDSISRAWTDHMYLLGTVR